MKVTLKNVRLSFPNIFDAVEHEGKVQYGAQFLIEPDSANAKAIEKAMTDVAKEKWADKGAAILKIARSTGSNKECCYWKGETKAYDGYDGMMVLTAKRNEDAGRPLVIDQGKNPLAASDGKPYAGCFVNASVDLWPQDNKHGKTVRATLMGVQFAKDGDAFGAGTQVADVDEFDDLSADDLV